MLGKVKFDKKGRPQGKRPVLPGIKKRPPIHILPVEQKPKPWGVIG